MTVMAPNRITEERMNPGDEIPSMEYIRAKCFESGAPWISYRFTADNCGVSWTILGSRERNFVECGT